MRFQRKRKRLIATEDSFENDAKVAPSAVIDLTGSDDDEPTVGLQVPACLTKHNIDDDDDDVVVLDVSKSRKAVKKESPKPRAARLKRGDDEDENDNDDNDVQVVDSPAPTLGQQVMAALDDLDDQDKEIAVVGTKNHVALSHMRQHCLQYHSIR